MYNRNAVRNIVSAHVNKINRDSKFYPKVCFYTSAVVAFLILNSHDYPTAGWVVMLVIASLTLICLGWPSYEWEEEFQGKPVPDALYTTINGSDAIEPGLMSAIRGSLSPDLMVRHLIEVEREYHRVKDITSGPGYRGLMPEKPKTN